MAGRGLDKSGSGQGHLAGGYEHGLTLRFHVMWEFLEQKRNCQLLKKDSSAWNRKVSIRISAAFCPVAHIS